MKIAIVGAGLSGLSLAWHLCDTGQCDVTVFDAVGIGGGASGIAAGLMHPYPGEQGRRSFLASEGMEATKKLLKVAEQKSSLPIAQTQGIIRYPLKEEVRSLFLSHARIFGDVEPHERGFLITSGMTIFCKPYLEGLWLAAQERGAHLIKRRVNALEELASYDQIVLAAGPGIADFPEARDLRIELLKGQILKCRVPPHLSLPTQSMIGKGYIAHAQEQGICYMGSTYERNVMTLFPDREKAEVELIPKVTLFYPDASSLLVEECVAAFRVMRIGHYFPIAARLKNNIWIISALGSRGLLYHGLIAERMKEAILKNEETLLPVEFTAYW